MVQIAVISKLISHDKVKSSLGVAPRVISVLVEVTFSLVNIHSAQFKQFKSTHFIAISPTSTLVSVCNQVINIFTANRNNWQAMSLIDKIGVCFIEGRQICTKSSSSNYLCVRDVYRSRV